MAISIRSLAVAAFAGLWLASAGCSNSSDSLADKLIGRWEGQAEARVGGGDGAGADVTMMQAGAIPVSFEFREDRTMTAVMLFPMSGTWEPLKSEGNKLTIKTVLEMPSFSFEQSTEQDGDAEPQTTQQTEMTTEKQAQELTIVFETDDRIVVTTPDEPEPLTLERKSGS